MRWLRIKLFWRSFSCPVESLASSPQYSSPVSTGNHGPWALLKTKTATADALTPFDSRSSSQKSKLMSSSCSANDSERRMTVSGEKREKRKGRWENWRAVGGPYVSVAPAAERAAYESALTYCRHARRGRLIYKITMHETYAHVCAHTRRPPWLNSQNSTGE